MNDEFSTIYYDGECALCHGWVQFVLKRDRAARFRFAPLQSSELDSSEPQLSTMLVRTLSGEMLARSDGVIYILKELGGFLAVMGGLLSVLPRPIRDFGYRCVAAVRRKLFSAPSDLCPVVPPEHRERFLS